MSSEARAPAAARSRSRRTRSIQTQGNAACLETAIPMPWGAQSPTWCRELQNPTIVCWRGDEWLRACPASIAIPPVQPYTDYERLSGWTATPGTRAIATRAFNGSSVAVGVDTCRALVRSNKKRRPSSTVAYLNALQVRVGPGGPTLGDSRIRGVWKRIPQPSMASGNFTNYNPGTLDRSDDRALDHQDKAYAAAIHNPVSRLQPRRSSGRQ